MSKINQINLSALTRFFIPCSKDMPQRRYDLDWLRILVFALLILFHTGMFYVENWGWHVKSLYQSQWLENIMLIVEPWRMAVLWVISGIAIRFVMAKVSVRRFIAMRSLRLLLPLLFGILVVIPPQLYIEMTYNGDLNMNYWQFLQAFFSSDSGIFENYQSGIWPHIDVNHLWFIRSLWQYSLVILCLLPILNLKRVDSAINWLFKQHSVVAIVIATLPLFIIQINWHQDSVRYPLGFTLMLYGYLIGWNSLFWNRLKNNLKPLLITAVISYGILVIFYNLVWLDVLKGSQSADSNLLLVGMFNYSLLRLLGVLTVFSFAHQFLNRKSKKLAYFNDAVYPFYILHQTIIVVIGYNLSSLNLGAILEPIILLLCTVASCFIGFEIIRRTEILRPFFGLKMSKTYTLPMKKLGYIAASCLILPIGWEVLV